MAVILRAARAAAAVLPRAPLRPRRVKASPFMSGAGGGGVLASSYYAHGGGGGGYSAVTRGSTYLIQAGGGGGGGGAGYSETGKAGGAGGGASGIAGSNSIYATGGGGGTSSAGGAAGNYYSVAGSANQGGGGGGTSTSCGSNAAAGTNGGGSGGGPYSDYYGYCLTYTGGGGGGGGGRYGGGGGGSTMYYSYYSGAGGAGGSDLVTGTSTVETAGSGTTPGNNTDSDYTGSVGVGAATVTSENGNAGNNGYVVISWTSTPPAYHVVGTYNGTTGTLYVNGTAQTTTFSAASAIGSSAQSVNLSRWPATPSSTYWNGMLDEVRISNTARSADWIKTEYNNQSAPASFYSLGTELASPPTVVRLVSFSAKGDGNQVRVEWKTATEVDTLGFNLYRSVKKEGPYEKLNNDLIVGLISSPIGRSYTYTDKNVIQGNLYYYKLEEIDLSGKRTQHGPVCVDWNEDGLRDDQQPNEIPSGENPESPTPGSNSNSATGIHSSPLGGNRYGYGPIAPVPDETLSRQARRQTILPEEDPASLQVAKVPGPISSQWKLASTPAVKLAVKERGWYRITQPDLINAGLDPDVNPRYFRLFVDGKELPMLVQGGKDGRFDPTDYVEFYGEAIDTLSTDTRIYWLVAGRVPGKRIRTVSNRSGRTSTESSYPVTVELKERTFYFLTLKNGEQNKYFGSAIGPESIERSLNIRHLDPSYRGNTTLMVSLQGVTLKPHSVRIYLNEVPVGSVVFDGQTRVVATMAVPQSNLLEGANVVRLEAEGADLDVTALDSIQLTYRHLYRAEGGVLRCTVSQGGLVTIDGFSSPHIRVVDVTNPGAVKVMAGRVTGDAASGYQVSVFKTSGTGTRTWLAFSVDAILSPAELKANQPSAWHQPRQYADLAIISHGNFMENLSPLKTLRESQGFSVALIDVEDLYDEFSYGAKTPQALKDFLARTRAFWQTPPRFVLLVGNASSDPRNYLGFGDSDFVPTKLVDTAYLETASDDWFVDFDNDGLPDLAIGRLPVQTAEEAATVVSRIIAYEQAEAGDWASEVLMVAGQNGEFDFEQSSREVGDLLPEEMTVWSVYRGQTDDETARTAILGSINEGKLIINYIGHGSVQIWQGNLLTSEDSQHLINGLRSPFFVNMTCLNGFFQAPYADSLAEALLKARQGGAIAVWASSGLTEPEGQVPMNKELIRLLFNGESLTLGEATAQAKAATTDPDVRRSWILFGDPTTRLKP